MNTKATRIALAVGALAIMTGTSQAAPLDQVQVDSPVVKVLSRDPATHAPIEQVTVTAHVIPDPDTLTTDSGVVLLNDYIREAARHACFEADPMAADDGKCYRDAMKAAKPQVAALVAHAKAAKSESAAS
jgi:UrcA family protein